MKEIFIDRFLGDTSLTVLDIGATDINGTYKHLFKDYSYIGADLQPGPNVDIVLPHPYKWDIGQWDIIISGQVLEHVEDIAAFMHAVHDALKPGGITCHIAPWQCAEHKGSGTKTDCWRILPDGMSWLFRNSQLTELLVDRIEGTIDTIGIARK